MAQDKNMHALERFLRACAQSELIDDVYNTADYRTLANMLRGDKKLDIVFVKDKNQMSMVQKMLKEADITTSPIRYDGQLAILYPRADREKYMGVRSNIINGGKLYSKGPYSYCDVKFMSEVLKKMENVKFSVYKSAGQIYICYYMKNSEAVRAAEEGLEKMRKNDVAAKYLQYEDLAFEYASKKTEEAIHSSDNVILLSESGERAVYFASDGVRVVKPGEKPYDIHRDDKYFKAKVTDAVFKNLVNEVGLIKVYKGDYARFLIAGASDMTKEEAFKRLGLSRIPTLDEMEELENKGLYDTQPEAYGMVQRMLMAQMHRIEDKDAKMMRPDKEDRKEYREIWKETIEETVKDYKEREEMAVRE